MPRFIDKTGSKFGRLTAQKVCRPGNGERIKWWCSCDCGNQLWVDSSDLGSGHTQSCGCLQTERAAQANSTHRYALPGRVSRTYLAWQRAKDRCVNPRNKRYADYGGRGVAMCDRWRENFEAFLDDMGDAPDGMSLDRWPNLNGNYAPGNCRWATPQMQSDNRRNTIWVEHEGERLSLKSYASRIGVSYKALFNRVRYKGQTPHEAAAALRPLTSSSRLHG